MNSIFANIAVVIFLVVSQSLSLNAEDKRDLNDPGDRLKPSVSDLSPDEDGPVREADVKRQWSQFGTWGKRWSHFPTWGKRWDKFTTWGKKWQKPGSVLTALGKRRADDDVDKRQWKQFITWGKRGDTKRDWSSFSSWGKRNAWNNFSTWGKRANIDDGILVERVMNLFDTNVDGVLDKSEMLQFVDWLTQVGQNGKDADGSDTVKN